MPRRIKSARISFLSLCPRGKNQLKTLYKEEDDTFQLEGISKAGADFDEEGTIIACVWAPNRLDCEQDWCAEPVIKAMAYGFMQRGKGIDIRHDERVLARDKVFIAESFLIQKDDPRFADMTDYEDQPVDVTGGWGVVLKVEDKTLRKAYRDGDWAGISMGGVALMDQMPPPIDKEDDTDGDDDMAALSKEELAAALTESNKSLVKDLGEVLAKAMEPKKSEKEEKEEETKKADDFELDLDNAEAIEKHLADLKRKAINKNDPKALEKRLAELRKTDDESDEDESDEDEPDEDEPVSKEDDEEDSPKVRRLKAQLRKAQGRSNVAPGDESDDKAAKRGTKVSKADSDAFKSGSSLAAHINKGLGTAKAS